nr:N-6 DNA methylase [Nocardiopsis mwathae]
MGLHEPAAPLSQATADAMEHGEVFTRGWVVDLILDLVGYTADRDLASLRLAEPACGAGAFMMAVTRRLSASCRAHGRDIADAVHAAQALDLIPLNVKKTQEVVRAQLLADGWAASSVDAVVEAWVRQGDYLLADPPDQGFDFVVGNPPYIRLEDVPRDRTAHYRAAYPTMGGRADVRRRPDMCPVPLSRDRIEHLWRRGHRLSTQRSFWGKSVRCEVSPLLRRRGRPSVLASGE